MILKGTYLEIIPQVPASQIAIARLQLMMVADNNVLLADTEKSVQELLNRLEEFYSNWDLSINIEKAIIVSFN